ncbi:MAG: aminodeoxychorismate synthase component I, partial [Rhizobiaceae bacterium]
CTSISFSRSEDQEAFFDSPVPLWDFEAYKVKFEKLVRHMQSGDCYQANLTFPIVCDWQGNPFELFTKLHSIQPVSNAAYVDLSGPAILSRSPEMFFRVERNGSIEARPMKGTAPRGKTKEEDEPIARELQEDLKNISENTMIVDLLRNDISHVSKHGSVTVPELCSLHSFATLHQLVSRVRGELRDGIGLSDIFRALFPCGSITGAPKIRAMEILHELEEGCPRDVYCGAIGWIEPTGAMQFNVPIRTMSLYDNNVARFNVGVAVTLDSNAKSEYDECLLKAKFVTDLIESNG